MRAGDLLTSAFPQAQACPETLPPGPVEPPMDHPVVRQTVHDCLNEAMDEAGYLEVVRALADRTIERRAIDVPEPSPFAQGILTAQPYTFLDDAPLEERRTHAVMSRRGLDRRQQDGIGALDPDAIARVRDEAWPQPSSAEEVHEALLWMGWVADVEADPWRPWLEALLAAGRVRRETGPLLLPPPPPGSRTPATRPGSWSPPPWSS
jgi:ATP-dependent Lhr-like helicase